MFNKLSCVQILFIEALVFELYCGFIEWRIALKRRRSKLLKEAYEREVDQIPIDIDTLEWRYEASGKDGQFDLSSRRESWLKRVSQCFRLNVRSGELSDQADLLELYLEDFRDSHLHLSSNSLKDKIPD